MTIIFLPNINQAIFAKEGADPFINGKLDVSVTDSEGKPIAATLFLCAKNIPLSGYRDAIPQTIMREGAHPLHVKIGDNMYHVGTVEYGGSGLKYHSNNTYSIAVDAAVLADRTYRYCLDFADRIKKLEAYAYGVDILNLNSEV